MEEQINIGGEGGGGDHLARKEEIAPNVSSQEETDVIQESMDVIKVIESFGDFRRTQRKECYNLVRRVKFLVPLLEEISELEKPLPDSLNASLCNLKTALFSTKKLLKMCRDKSKIYLAYEGESIMSKFHALYDKLSMALDAIPFDEFSISDEVKEQVELMSVQFKRAKRRSETQDIELAMDMMVVFSEKDDRNADSAILERLAKKLELHGIQELRRETIDVRKLVKERKGQNTEGTQKIIDLLNKFKKIAGLEVFDVLNDPDAPKVLVRSPSLAIPHEFLCPITLEIMTDPVTIASGQTYERESIEKWFEANHSTCPKTRQTLAHFSVYPNFALKNLILQWCEKYKFEQPKKEAPSTGDVEGSSLEQSEEVASAIENLSSSHLDVQRTAVTKIRMLSKENPENRVMIAEKGGIPLLFQLLSYPDSKIQEHTVTALLNLSIDDKNRRLISKEPGAIPAIIEVLEKGSIEAKENSAACLFSLSMLDENKVAIGALGGIPPLVDLLQNGTSRGKKDAITALFNLSFNQENRAKAIEAGIVKPLLKLLARKNLDMVNEALSIFLILASHPEGRSELGQLSFIETLVEFIKDGTPKNKECAVSVLLQLGMHNSSSMLAALQYGVFEHLVEVSKSGTNRAQRKANLLLSYMSKHEQIP